MVLTEPAGYGAEYMNEAYARARAFHLGECERMEKLAGLPPAGPPVASGVHGKPQFTSP